MKCKCGKEAVTFVRILKKPLCSECFTKYYLSSVSKSIEKFKILKKDEKILAAVSGGKDSSAMAFSLKKLGYNFEILYIDLGIGNYSKECRKAVEELSSSLNVNLNILDLKDYGFTIEDVKKKHCSACGIAKRYLMNKFARNRFDVIATGHTVEDLVSFYLKNIYSGMTEFAEKIRPRNEPFDPKIVARAKPIFLMSEKENFILVTVNDVPFTHSECPFAPEQVWKEIIYKIEFEKPGFSKNFLRNLMTEPKSKEVKYCKECGEVSNSDLCSFCKIRKRFHSSS